MHRATLMAALLLGLVGCSTSVPLPESRSTVGGKVFSMAGLITGEIWADDRGCLFIRSDGELVWAGWPAGYVLLRNPLRVLNERGQVVAEEGKPRSFGGGLTPAPNAPCRNGPEWWAVSPDLPSSSIEPAP